MLSPSAPKHATGDETQVSPSSSLVETVEQSGTPLARKLTEKIRPVRWSTTRNGSRLWTGPTAGETSRQGVKLGWEGKMFGVRGAPWGGLGCSCHSWKKEDAPVAGEVEAGLQRAPAGVVAAR